MYHFMELVPHILRADNFDHAPEFKDPEEESRAYRDLGIELEVILFHGGGFHLAAECRYTLSTLSLRHS